MASYMCFQKNLFEMNTGMEDSNEVRPLVPVTEEEPPGHVALEKEQATAERRPPRNGYKDVPLLGVINR